MADVTGSPGNAGIWWIRDTSDEDQPMVFVPGVSKEGNLHVGMKEKPGFGREMEKMKLGYSDNVRGKVIMGSRVGRRKKLSMPHTQEPKASVPVFGESLEICTSALAAATIRSPAGDPHPHTALLTMEQAVPEVGTAKSHASLKDLCPEDKRRIASLIQELARVSEEKDETMRKLQDEHESFERKIQQLEEQNHLIVQEREDLQQQYRECQELLSLYQQYLSQQQEKLSQSIAQLNQSHAQSKVNCGEDASTRVLEQAGLDGSYLGLPVHGKGGISESSSHTGMATQHLSTRKQGKEPAEPGAQHAGLPGLRQEPQHGQPFRHLGSVNRRSLELCASSCAHHTEKRDGQRTQHLQEKEPGEYAEITAAPSVGQESWEMRRHRLLLQKMELEVERERLQACLAQQEERLVQQNQWLRRCRLPKAGSQTDVRPGFADLDELSSTGENLLTGNMQNKGTTCHLPHTSVCLREAVTPPIKDAATSPVLPHSRFPPAFGPCTTPLSSSHHQAECRGQDSSLTGLLEVITPVSGWDEARLLNGHNAPQTPLHALRDYAGASFATFSPVPLQPNSMQEEDPEESQLLEEIFFIC